jgi:hypothetical protein
MFDTWYSLKWTEVTEATIWCVREILDAALCFLLRCCEVEGIFDGLIEVLVDAPDGVLWPDVCTGCVAVGEWSTELLELMLVPIDFFGPMCESDAGRVE